MANLFQAQAMLGGYYAGGPWQEKLKLRIVGKLTEKLSVSYDLEQMPDTPDKFDVKVTYDRTELTFGDFQANFSKNEFVSTSKYLNGVMITSSDNWYDLVVVPSSKLKSETQRLVSQRGNNTKGPYNLGHGSIIEGSERVELNNVLLDSGADYTIDYFSGKITFSRILSPDDEFKYSYEFTNLIDILFPTVSKRDFVGLQTGVTVNPTLLGMPAQKTEKSVRQKTEIFPTKLQIPPAAASGEAAPATPEAEEEYQRESTGNYRLTASPVIPYSEKVTFMGTQLKKIEDYIINYQDGTITLLRPTLPTMEDPLAVEYQYIEVTEEAQAFTGAGKGPYVLSSRDVIEESDSVYVNNIPYIRQLDYKIDYDLGRIMFFTDVPQTAQIIVKYKHLVTTTTPPPPAPVVPRSLNFGVSYLKESGQRGITPPSIAAMDTKSGSDIINDDNTIYLNFWPVTSTDEVEVRRNDIVLAYGTDYVFPTVEASTRIVIPATKLAHLNDPADISDGLKTGTIKFLAAVSTTDEVTVSYNYSKWSSDLYTDSGGKGKGPYSLGSFRNLVPGAEIVQIWKKSDPTTIKTLKGNSSIEVFDGYYSLNYSDPPNITFNNDLIVIGGETYNLNLNDVSFTVTVKFVAQSSASDAPISHDVIGSDFNLLVGDYLKLGGAFARSKTDQVYTTVITKETFNGNGTIMVFNLNSLGQIIDGSEQVILNDKKLNRDDQYSFYYGSNSSGKYGVLIFPIIAPATADVISIDYSYQDIFGPAPTVSEKQGSAYKLGGTIKPFSNMEFAADYKKIDADFSPMGGTSIPLGSDLSHAYTKITPFPAFWSSFWVSGDIKSSNAPISNYPDKFLHATDRNLSAGFNPLGLAQVNMNFREYDTLDDLLSKSANHNNDYESLAYSVSLVPNSLSYGVLSFSNKNDASYSISSTDTKDRQLSKDTKVEYCHTNNRFDLTSRFNLTLDYQKSSPSTISYEAGSRSPSRSQTINRKVVEDKSYYLNSDLNYWNFKRVSVYINRLEHEDNADKPTKVRLQTLNETYHADFVPIDQISTSVDHNRQETPTITTAFGNPKTERSSAYVRVTPFSTTSLGWSGSIDDSLQENGAKTSGSANTYTVYNTLLSGANYKLATNYNLGTSLRTGPVGSAEVTTDTRSFSQDYGLTVTPTTLWTITSGVGQEDYTNKNNDPATPVDTKSQAQTIRVGSSYKATGDLNLSGNYSVKVTRTPDQSAHKSLVDAHAVYAMFTYGTLNYDWSQEDNGGEILGGSFSDQDFTKILQSLSLNFVMPQSKQMILSSIVLKAAVKWANYSDRKTPVNSFQATLLSFEGTFNF